LRIVAASCKQEKRGKEGGERCGKEERVAASCKQEKRGKEVHSVEGGES